MSDEHRRKTQAGIRLGTGHDGGQWFVYDRMTDDAEWRKHCGPYSTREQAEDWIDDLREDASRG